MIFIRKIYNIQNIYIYYIEREIQEGYIIYIYIVNWKDKEKKQRLGGLEFVFCKGKSYNYFIIQLVLFSMNLIV